MIITMMKNMFAVYSLGLNHGYYALLLKIKYMIINVFSTLIYRNGSNARPILRFLKPATCIRKNCFRLYNARIVKKFFTATAR